MYMYVHTYFWNLCASPRADESIVDSVTTTLLASIVSALSSMQTSLGPSSSLTVYTGSSKSTAKPEKKGVQQHFKQRITLCIGSLLPSHPHVPRLTKCTRIGWELQ